ncbi:hypothetical protein HYC85_007576 [Camellia sinensis]|uniref:Uncharacterized protein n=1 Tax=Camellia sinensis TaxID=4442 RepID=A0A7J7HPB7_CAMSI|nr:hypothetical protein HYC85_007576 [Camellia sinensis]
MSMHADFLTQLRIDDQNKGQEDVKTNLVGGLKSISDQVSQEIDRDTLKEISSMISALPEQIDLCLQKLKSELCKTVTQEMQACSIERERRIVIESDEEIDVGFSCLLEEKDTDIGNYSMEEAKEETKRILRKARREKRKYSNAIILI